MAKKVQNSQLNHGRENFIKLINNQSINNLILNKSFNNLSTKCQSTYINHLYSKLRL